MSSLTKRQAHYVEALERADNFAAWCVDPRTFASKRGPIALAWFTLDGALHVATVGATVVGPATVLPVTDPLPFREPPTEHIRNALQLIQVGDIAGAMRRLQAALVALSYKNRITTVSKPLDTPGGWMIHLHPGHDYELADGRRVRFIQYICDVEYLGWSCWPHGKRRSERILVKDRREFVRELDYVPPHPGPVQPTTTRTLESDLLEDR